MKKILCLPILLLLITISACKKKSSDPVAPPPKSGYNDFTTPIPDDAGCVSRIWLDTLMTTLTAGRRDTAIALFKQNNLPYDKVFFFTVTNDTFGGGNNVQVNVRPYVNGLLIFNQVQNYRFDKDGKLFYSNSRSYSVAPDTIAVLRPAQLRSRFFDCVVVSGLTGIKKDTCLSAQFGYFDMSDGKDTVTNLVKIWMVYPQHTQVPIAFVREDGTVDYFYIGSLH